MEISVQELEGEILTHIDDCDDGILLTTASGRKIRMYHQQDCCESVSIVGTDGEWHKLIGKPLLEVDVDNTETIPPSEYADSYTQTNFTFRVDDATVICRWIGESNGYYSESVSLEEITENGR